MPVANSMHVWASFRLGSCIEDSIWCHITYASSASVSQRKTKTKAHLFSCHSAAITDASIGSIHHPNFKSPEMKPERREYLSIKLELFSFILIMKRWQILYGGECKKAFEGDWWPFLFRHSWGREVFLGVHCQKTSLLICRALMRLTSLVTAMGKVLFLTPAHLPCSTSHSVIPNLWAGVHIAFAKGNAAEIEQFDNGVPFL